MVSLSSSLERAFLVLTVCWCNAATHSYTFMWCIKIKLQGGRFPETSLFFYF